MHRKVVDATEAFLKKNSSSKSKELVKKMIAWSYGEIEKHPMLLQHDLELELLLVRRLPKEILDRYPDLEMEVVKLLVEHGVQFTCETEIVRGVFRALGTVYADIMTKNDPAAKTVMDMLINGAVNEIVAT
ncbi:MAG: hypothetical protein FWC75_00490 [Oscillospiraceae bacterium]|nr:hypothetical protein [Oscillospiraceae bacterium]